VPESDLQLLGFDLQLLGYDLHELFQWLRQISVLVERLDQKRHQVPIARFQLRERELLVQMLSEVGRIGCDLGIVVFVGIIANTRARAALAYPVELG